MVRKRKIKYLQTINYSTGEVVQEFEMKMEDDLYDNLHDKKDNVNEYRDLHKENFRKKDKNHKQPPKLPERRNPTDLIITPNSLVESIEAEFKDIRQKYEVQGSDDDDTGNYPNLATFPEMEELKMQTNDLKGSSAKKVKFDNSVTVYSNESEDINEQEVCDEKATESTDKVESEFAEQVDKITTVDMDLPSYDDVDTGELGFHEEYEENMLQNPKQGIKKASKEDEYNDEEDDFYESYDDSFGKNKGTDKYNTTLPKKPFKSKENGNRTYDDEMIEEFVYEESQTAEIDHKNTSLRDTRTNDAQPLQQQITDYDGALYEEPVSSHFRDSGLPNVPTPNTPKLPTLTMPLEKKLVNNFQADGEVLHWSKEGLSDESIIAKSVKENGESNQKTERSISEITALSTSSVPPAVPKRKGKVAPILSVSPSEDEVGLNIKGVKARNKINIGISENISGNVLGDIGEDNRGFDFHDVSSIQPQTVPRKANGLSSPVDQSQIMHPLTKSSYNSSDA
ncbi:hypothetical protein CHS0354_004092 [Potamilus streckersoni]|uniref:Uncharacterized protein n=1 Tax=Potamilus streckersoni TaxID=2493646 RepID=A0AAE0SJ44_9BIVA|nr:hypothetical protein CHS0354_004092 [Potamilus streckersoni]